MADSKARGSVNDEGKVSESTGGFTIVEDD